MKLSRTILALVITLPVLGGQTTRAADPEPALPLPPIPDWLMGCWETPRGTREVWLTLHPDIAFGSNVAVKPTGEMVFFEQLRIQRTPEGLVFAAYPAGNGPTFFYQIPSLDGALVFANADHDSPQVIRYQKTSEGVTSSAMQLDGTGRSDWSMKRCSRN